MGLRLIVRRRIWEDAGLIGLEYEDSGRVKSDTKANGC